MTVTTRQTSEQASEHLRVFMGGLPGPGLPRTAATWPDPLFALCSPHLRSLSDQDLPYVPVGGLGALKQLLAAIGQAPAEREQAFGRPVSTLVIHTLDGLERALQDDQHVENPCSVMQMVLRAMTALPVHVVLLSHLRTVDDRLEPALLVADEVAAYVDVALLVSAGVCTETVGSQTTRTLRHFLQAWPDARHPWITDHSGHLPAEMVATFTDDYERLVEALTGGPPRDLSALTSPARRRVARKAPPVVRAAPAPPPASAEPPVATEPASPEPPAAEAPSPAAEVEVAPPPPPARAPEAAGDDEGQDVPPCSVCGGTLGLTERETADQMDLARVRRHDPMCKACEAQFMESKERVIPRKARPAPTPAAAPVPPATPTPAPATEPVAVVPRGEIVGQFPVHDDALRALLNTDFS